MKICVFGATGGCGRATVDAARSRCHEVRAVVRRQTEPPSEWPSSVEVVRADPYSAEALDEAIAGVGAVISCIGIRRRNPLNPWSPLASPRDTAQRCTSNILTSMQRTGVSRLACISAAGVGDSRSTLWPPLGMVIALSNIGVAYRDLCEMERVLQQSSAEWLAVRPTTLTSSRAPHRLATTSSYRYLSRVPRRTVAEGLVDFCEANGRAGGGCWMVTGRRDRDSSR